MRTVRSETKRLRPGREAGTADAAPASRVESTSTMLPCGVSVAVSRFYSLRTETEAFEFDCSPLHFGYQLSGTTEAVHHGGGSRRTVFAPGSNGVGYYPHSGGELRYSGGEEHCAITLLVPPEVLARYLESGEDDAPRELAQVVEGRPGVRFVRPGHDTPAKRRLLARVFDGLCASGIGTLFLESACLELMGLQLREYAQAAGGRGEAGMFLTPGDRERIREASRILVRDFENPPSITDLARQVGINDFKLKQGFRAVFGTTVYGYFRNCRLERARECLDAGEMNVTEAASLVGYRNFGHFSKAFFDRFGIRPCEYRFRHRARRA